MIEQKINSIPKVEPSSVSPAIGNAMLPAVPSKGCSRCGEEKPLSEYYIIYDKHVARCKVCFNNDCKSYVERNKEKRKKYQDDYNKANRDKQIVHKRNYQKKAKDILRQKGRKRYEENRDRLLAQTKVKQKQYAEELHDCYMRNHLRKLGFKKQEVEQFPEIKETVKLIIQTKRLCKTLQN
ncbi:MAG: hypothetical protein V4615_05140 [Bacteroidota bacterium]